jgi:hypothetical protein
LGWLVERKLGFIKRWRRFFKSDAGVRLPSSLFEMPMNYEPSQKPRRKRKALDRVLFRRHLFFSLRTVVPCQI